MPDSRNHLGLFPDLQVVGVGASAGGLEACTVLLDALPADTGMAFILVQHLHPTHESLLVELLASHTSLAVVQAAEGMPVESDHLYVIPPASFLTVVDGMLHLETAPASRGARLPFDALLLSLAHDFGARASCVVLSGSGADGSVGLLEIKRRGGYVIVQEPGEAAYDGMPRNAIATGAVDAIRAVAAVPDALAKWKPELAAPLPDADTAGPPDHLSDIIDLLRIHTAHDFTLYKPGTLRRRVERRMAMAAIGSWETDRYIAILRDDPAEAERLAKDLLIHVTGFFRDPAIFDEFARTVARDLIRSHPPDQPLRIWVAGCSTGEEAYSLAIVFREQIAAATSSVKLQIFASDRDTDAVASAREGFYPATIEADVTPQRLAAFFVKEEHGYRVLPDLRAMIVFTVQDLLADPPFSRLDLVSCRNVMIYLGAEAQRKVIALFHFAIRPGGALLLGSSESVGNADGCFEVISKAARLFRHVGRSRPGEVDFGKQAGGQLAAAANVDRVAAPSRQTGLAELCRAQTLQAYAPATVLVNHKHELLFALGSTERYLHVASGHVTSDILLMVPDDLRARLRSAILRTVQNNAPVTAGGGQTVIDGRAMAFSIEVRPVRFEDEDLLLVHFIDQPERDAGHADNDQGPQVVELKRQLQSTQQELQGAVGSLQIAADEQKSINENALSINEEFQSTNEELLTSKEELQSLNEELTALNSQLQETLEQQRTTANDLQNVLFSTDVATLFLDSDLNIRFFTPATKSLFNLIKTDVGRPLADLQSLAADSALPTDARMVIENQIAIEQEVETATGVWCRRILPYRTHDGAVEGVVITFTDVTERKHAAAALESARHEAELANAAKSHFLAAASHDLRQPLQTLTLLQGLLSKRVAGTAAADLTVRLEDTLGAMSAMLNTLLDINQIEAGVVEAVTVDFAIDGLLRDLEAAFTHNAKEQGLDLRVVLCGLTVRSDPRLLEQILRNLMSNALKYTRAGKVLLGCRRDGGTVRIEVWDTGIGIPGPELRSIFAEYRQLDNAALERSRGLGLGLSIVSRLGALLHHRIGVRSRPGLGSVFTVDVPVCLPEGDTRPSSTFQRPPTVLDPARTGTVLVVEDDAQVRELLTMILSEDGHEVVSVPNGPAALRLVDDGKMRPDLLLTDYNLPHGMDGLAVASAVRARLGANSGAGDLPVIILTGDISTQALRTIARQRCLQLNKPVKPSELTRAIRTLLPDQTPGSEAQEDPGPIRRLDAHVIFVVDDDRKLRSAVCSVLEEDGRTVRDFATSEAFLAAYTPGSDGCLLVDAYLPGMGGLELLRQLRARSDLLPTILITGSSDVPMAVQAMKAGAADFIEKPIAGPDLLNSIDRALERSRDTSKLLAWQTSAADHIAGLTSRQHEIMDLVLAGHPSKNIAADLGISQRTVENHRASIMKATGTRSIPALARLALAASAARNSAPAFNAE